MKKRILALLGLTSIALVASVISFSGKDLKSEEIANDPSSLIGETKNFEGEGYAFPASTYMDSPTNEPKYSNTTTFTDIGSYSQKTATYDRINVEQVWSSYRGDAVKVALIDTGCNMDHEEFSGTIFNSNSKDIGNSTYSITDTSGHGTDTAACVAASINNKGGSGIAPNVDLYIIRAVNASNGFPTATLQSALNYCINQGVDIINMSIQGYPEAFSYSYVDDMKGETYSGSISASMYKSTLQDEIDACYEAGITVVAAAGNYNKNINTYPAANDHVIAVASTGLNSDTAKAGFSNYGDWVDVAAPGYVIVPSTASNTSYCLNGGTSFSAPIVTGAIALYKQKYPTATPDQIETALKATAHSLTWSSGAGQIDVEAFLDKAPDHIYVQSVELDEHGATLSIGETLQLNTTVLPVDATNTNVIYESDDESVCTVDDSGLITAIGEGSTFVRVTSEDDDNKADGIEITVEEGTPTGEFTLVTSESNLSAGDKVLFVSESGETINGGLSGAFLEAVSVTNVLDKTNHKLSTIPEGAVPITLGGSSGAWTFTLDNSTLLYGSDSGFSTSSGHSNSTISFSSNDAIVKFNGTSQLKYNSSSPRFRPYGSTVTGSVQIYKLTGGGMPIQGYTVSFNANGGTGTMDSSLTSGTSYTTPLCGFSKTNYVFDKWALNSASGTQYSAGETITGISSNITLYAIWKSGTTPTPGPDNTYYSEITATSGTSLLGQLHTLMGKTHNKFTTYDDCKDPNKVYSTDPGTSSSYVTDFYTQKDIAKAWGSGATGTWNREHVWCQSLTNSLWGETYGGSDLQHVRPLESTLNSTRNNHPFGELSNRESKKVYSKDKNKNQLYHGGYCDTSLDIFEPLDTVKGDVARILMYDYMHYSNATGGTDGKVSGHTGNLQINKIVKTSANTAQAAWNLLLEWNEADDVDQAEITRNEAAYTIQGNRNPFIDHPEYAAAIWGNTPISTKTLTGITLSGNQKTTFSVGETFTYSGLVVTAHYSDNTQSTVTPTSVSSPTMSTQGQKPVTVSYTEGGVTKEANYTITVSAIAVTGVTMNPISKTMKIGDNATLTATVAPNNATNKNVAWSSSDSTTVSVDSSGNIKALKAGNATIKVKTSDGDFEATCAVTVSEPVVDNVSLDILSKVVRFTTGAQTNTFTITATLVAETGAEVTWTSSDNTVVRQVISGSASSAATTTTEVEATFEVLKTGTATITATAGDESATCEVRATLPVKSYRVETDTTQVPYNGSTSTITGDIYEVYTDDSEAKVQENVNLTVDSSSLGNKTASIIYEGQTVTTASTIKVTNTGSSETITDADAAQQAEAWAIYFIAMTRTDDTCLARTDELRLSGLKAVWGTLSTEYVNMIAASKDAFCSSSASAKIKEALQHYQHIISKFNKNGTELSDFVTKGDGITKPAPVVASSKYSLQSMFTAENGAVITAIFSLIGIAAIVTFVVVKRRKTY